MKKVQKLFGIGALTLALSACENGEAPKPDYLEGKLIKNECKIPITVKIPRLFFDEKEIKVGKCVLTVDTDYGRYTFNVVENGEKPLVVLAERIKEGDRIRFQTNEFYPYGGFFKTNYKERKYFSNDGMGKVPSNKIEIIEKPKK